jgi:hypothetical protein
MLSGSAVCPRKILATVGLVLSAVGASRVARAQGTILHAIVADANTNDYLGDASVTISPLGVKATSDFSGDTRFSGLKKGHYTVSVRRLGYAPLDTDLLVTGRDSAEITFMMRPLTRELATVTVEETATTAFLREFEQRRKLGTGYYVTDSVLRASLGTPLGNIISSRVPGVAYLSSLDILSSARGPNNFNGGTSCPITVYWNGIRTGFRLSEIPIDFIGGVEFYNPGHIPAQYQWPGSGCGVLLLWPRP